MSSALRPLVLLGLLLGLAGPAAAGAQESLFKLHDNTLEVSIVRPLPDVVSDGMSAMYVDLRNDGGVTRDVALRYRPQRGSQQRFEINARVSVPAGTTVRHEMLLPAFASLYSGEFTAVSGSDEETKNSLSVRTGNHWGAVLPVLVLGDGSASAAELAVWNEQLSRVDLNAGKTSRGGTTSKPLLDLQLGYLAPEDLPRRFESYSGLAALLVDTSFSPPPSVLEPALRWMRLGGTVIFCGPDAARRAEALPGLALWLQERFRYVNSLQPAESPGVDIFHCGLGQLVIAESESFVTEGQLEGLQMAIFENRGFVPDNDGAGLHHYRFSPGAVALATGVSPGVAPPNYIKPLTLEGVGELPYRLFILLLIGFFVIVAPLNFRLVKRTGRPAWLLLTIPVLAGIASTSFLAYGIFYQGLGLTQGSVTLTVLDQREHRSQTANLRTFFAGMAPRDGLQPEAGSLVIPIEDQWWRRPASFHRIDMGSSLSLKGDYLPVRTEGTQLVLSDRAARGRLQFEFVGENVELTNGLGAVIERVALRAPGGELFLFESDALTPIQEGASQLLRPAGPVQPDLSAWLDKPRGQRDLGWAEDLPEGMYLAILQSNPFADDTGLVPDEERGTHELFGILPQDPEEWK